MRNPGLTLGLLAGAAVLALSGFEYGLALAGSSTAASGSSHAAPSSPRCSKGVHWHVMAEPVTASAEQIRQIATVMGANARPVQPTGQRLVLAPAIAN